MIDIEYLLEVAWRDTGIFLDKFFFDPGDNLTGDAMSVEAMRGRDFESQGGRWTPGQLKVLLRNDDGKYSPSNTESPLFGILKTDRPVTLSAGLREPSLAAQFVAASTRYLMHADNADLSMGNIYFEFMVWVSLDSLPTAGNMMGILGKWQAASREYILFVDNIAGTVRFKFSVRDIADTVVTTVAADNLGDVSVDIWYMLRFGHHPDSNVIYIAGNDGVSNSTVTIGGVRDGTAPFEVGRRAVGNYFDGHVGPIALWKPGALPSAAQRTWLYNEGRGRDFTELGVDGTDGQYLIRNAAGVTILKQWNQMDEVLHTRGYDIGVSLAEAVGGIGSSWGLDTRIYRRLWAGSIDSITPSIPVAGALHTATIEGVGPLSLFAAAKELGLPATADLTGAQLLSIVQAFCGAVDFYSLDWDDGRTTTGMFYPKADMPALELIRQMEDCEPGLLYETLSYRLDQQREYWIYKFLLGYIDRWHRLMDARSLAAQATFSDTPGSGLSVMGVEQLDPLNDIYNNVQVSVPAPDTEGGLAVLWTFSGPAWGGGGGVSSGSIYLAPRESKRVIAKYPTAATTAADSYVDDWTTPTTGIIGSGADIQHASGQQVTVTNVAKSADEMAFTLFNESYVHDTICSLVQARGIPWTKNPPTLVSAEDAASIAIYGLREYPLPPEWMPSAEEGQNFCDYIVSRFRDPHNRLRLTFAASKSDAAMRQALTGRIGDRIEIDLIGASGLGISDDYYIESIHHVIDMGKTRHIVTYEVASCSGEGAYWVLDYSRLGIAIGVPYPTSRLEY